MPRYAENVLEVVRRGGVVFADSRLAAVACCGCERSFLRDASTGRLFIDPVDLRQSADVAACPSCGDDLEDVPADEFDRVCAGPWGFAFWRPSASPATRRRAARVALMLIGGVLVLLGAVAVAVNPDPFAAPGHGRPQVEVPAGR